MSATISLLSNAKRAIQRPFTDHALQKTAMQDSSWADGLRGIASVFVVSSHLVLCFARRLVVPCCSSDERTVALFQRPILRLVAQGQAWVALFFILSGFVNALKPLKLARAGQIETALTNLSLSSFRRTFRLMLPAATATVLSWFVTQLGAYQMARQSNAYWLYTYTPLPSSSWIAALEDLVNGLRATWTIGVINTYDQPQWALIYLLQGSMMVFCALLIVVNLTPLYRTLMLGSFAMWSFDWSYKHFDRKYRSPVINYVHLPTDASPSTTTSRPLTPHRLTALVGFTVFAGILLAEFSLTTTPTLLAYYSPFLTPPLATLALVLMSFPSDAPLSAPWSTTLLTIGQRLLPPQLDFGRTYGSLGALLLVLAIIISPHARAALASPPLALLGRLSFPIYLLHGTFLRSLFAWCMFAGTGLAVVEERNADGSVTTSQRLPLPGAWRTAGSVLLSMAACGLASYAWAVRVEPWFGRFTRWAEETMMGKRGGEALPVRKE
ncbi:hypothetical protein MMC26_001918 [Xylographa opegraphella]|nr:hypothetical protein [Xylographa opegraphella]